jgi:hypothetical protein
VDIDPRGDETLGRLNVLANAYKDGDVVEATGGLRFFPGAEGHNDGFTDSPPREYYFWVSEVVVRATGR